MEEPASGIEILWEDMELRPDEVGERIKPKGSLGVFATASNPAHGSGWYLCELVFVEVHDTGTHGDTVLVWVNSYLLEASDDESAYALAVELRSNRETESGSHRCDGDSAHWEFRGLRDLNRILEAPRDGAILWFDEENRPLHDVLAAVERPTET